MRSVVVALIFLSFGAHAAVDSFTTAAKVKSFTTDTAVVESNGHVYKVKRSAILQKKIKAGDAVMVKLGGDELGLQSEQKPATQK